MLARLRQQRQGARDSPSSAPSATGMRGASLSQYYVRTYQYFQYYLLLVKLLVCLLKSIMLLLVFLFCHYYRYHCNAQITKGKRYCNTNSSSNNMIINTMLQLVIMYNILSGSGAPRRFEETTYIIVLSLISLLQYCDIITLNCVSIIAHYKCVYICYYYIITLQCIIVQYYSTLSICCIILQCYHCIIVISHHYCSIVILCIFFLIDLRRRPSAAAAGWLARAPRCA